jgi:hypothetical protein
MSVLGMIPQERILAIPLVNYSFVIYSCAVMIFYESLISNSWFSFEMMKVSLC